MKVLAFVGAVAMLCACAQHQPGAVLPESRIALVKSRIHTQDTLLYATNPNNVVYVIAVPRGKLVGKLSGIAGPEGICSDRAGDVFIASTESDEIFGYRHASNSPFEELTDDSYLPESCAIDPKTGDLAVANCCHIGTGSSNGNVAIYRRARGAPRYYADPPTYTDDCTYDDGGNLYILGGEGSAFQIAVKPAGAHAFRTINLHPSILGNISAVRWDGKYLAIATAGEIEQYEVSGNKARAQRVHVTTLSGVSSIGYFWIGGSGKTKTLYAPITENGVQSIGVYAYPEGGDPQQTWYDAIYPYGVTLSVPNT